MRRTKRLNESNDAYQEEVIGSVNRPCVACGRRTWKNLLITATQKAKSEGYVLCKECKDGELE